MAAGEWWRDGTQTKMPGSPEPLAKCCGSLLRNAEERYGEKRYCTKPKGWKTNHPGYRTCAWHGGTTPTMEKAAGRDMAEQELKTLSARLGKSVLMDSPEEEILRLAGEVLEWRTVLREKLDDLNSLDIEDNQGVSRMKAIVTAFQEALRDSRDILQVVHRMDIATRRQELDEKVAEMVATAMLAVIYDSTLGLTDIQVEAARGLLAEKLGELAPNFRRPDNRVLDAVSIEITA